MCLAGVSTRLPMQGKQRVDRYILPQAWNEQEVWEVFH